MMKKIILLLIGFLLTLHTAISQEKKDSVFSWNNCDVSFITLILESFPPQYRFIPQKPDSMGRYYWDFGDGTSSYNISPTHVYAYSGIYVVNLFYTSADSCTAFATDTINATGQMNCNAEWTFSNAIHRYGEMPWPDTGSVIAPSLVFFNDQSMGHIDSWHWEFGDSTFSESQNPVHNYSSEGAYNVCLTIHTKDNCTSTKCQVIELQFPGECNTTGFVKDYTGLDGCGLVIVLDNGTVLEPAENVSGVELIPGQRIRLGYTELTDRASICMVGPIVRINCISPITDDSCIIDFNFFSLPWVSSWPPIYRFDPIPDMFIKEIHWDFGDGTASTEEIPHHRFPHDGYYTICMSIKTYMGCDATICKTAYFEGYDEEPGLCDHFIKLTTEVILNGQQCHGTATAMLVDAIGNPVEATGYLWSTGDTGSSVSQLCPGIPYHVLVTDANGCAVSGSFSFGDDHNYPDSLIGYWNYEQDAYDFVFNLPVFSDSLRCEWDFGDGEQAEGVTVNHTYESADTYTVNFRVKDTEGNILYTESILISAGNPTATNKTESEPPVVYPVPVKDQLNIVLSKPKKALSIEIMTIGGQTIRNLSEINQNHNRIEVNVSDLISGFYIGNIKFESGEVQSFRFIK